MRTTEVARIRSEAWAIVTHPAAKRFEKIEALKLICATKGILVPDLDERFLTVRQALQLRQAKSRVLENALKRREKVRAVNRKAYLKRRLKELEAGGVEGIEVTAELPAVSGQGEKDGKDN